ncbi:MAG: flagellar biosynthesis protein FlhB [Lachnospiraceae bacterium]|nr:flagellar biosynthesis protein FlhB [Lachnospiraceae bacterium]
MIGYDLQFFAKDGPGGEKTEPATQKKLDDARKEGQVAKSKEVSNAALLLALFALMGWLVAYYGRNFLDVFSNIYNRIPEWCIMYDGSIPYATIYSALRRVIIEFLIIVLPALIIGFLVPFIANLVQVKWKVSAKPMQPKLSKINPLNGIKRLFSLNSLMELIKSLLKIAIIGLMVFFYLRGEQDKLLVIMDMSIMDTLSMLSSLIVNIGLRISVAYIILALADYMYQRWKFSEDMKMTKQEVKDEYKNMEGDPQIKGQQRRRMQEASRRRMMQQLPQADVVITNPTHYAVAIKYDPDKYEAPFVVAKGADYLAARIKEIAKENNIEIYEDKPLARMLYANVEVNQIVPPELYQAVAEVLAFVYHLQGRV